MRHRDESPSDRVWKEKLDCCATWQEGVLLLVLMAVLAGLLVFAA